MPLCVGIAFKRVAKSFWFDPNGLVLSENDRVIVETSHGIELGMVKIGVREVSDADITSPLKRVIRRAGDADYLQERENREKARNALSICGAHLNKLELPMRLLQAEFCFDASQVTIYFTAEARVDFRELVREVGSGMRCKVLLHQVGARDQARMIGGVGPCGLTLCCATFLSEFAPISMKMAKDQSLFLNPVKFSGVCGKLMCCLRYEHEDGVEKEPKRPGIGDIVMSPAGQGKMMDMNTATGIAIVRMLDGGEEIEVPAVDLRLEKTTRCTDCRGCSVSQLEDDEADAVRVNDETRRMALEIAEHRSAEMTSLNGEPEGEETTYADL